MILIEVNIKIRVEHIFKIRILGNFFLITWWYEGTVIISSSYSYHSLGSMLISHLVS